MGVDDLTGPLNGRSTRPKPVRHPINSDRIDPRPQLAPIGLRNGI